MSWEHLNGSIFGRTCTQGNISGGIVRDIANINLDACANVRCNVQGDLSKGI